MFPDISSAEAKMLSISPLEKSSIVTRSLFFSVTSIIPLRQSCDMPQFLCRKTFRDIDDGDFIDAINLFQAYLDFLVTGAGHVLAGVGGAHGELTVTAVNEHGKLNGSGASKVNEGIHRGAGAASGKEYIIDKDDKFVINGYRNIGQP